jgi:beta-alanine degradation protein BauB
MRQRSKVNATVQVDEAALRVTRFDFPPGSETGWHRHAADYVVVPLRGGTLTVEDSSGASTYPIETGQSYARPAGVEHNIANDTDEEISFVEVEILDRRG